MTPENPLQDALIQVSAELALEAANERFVPALHQLVLKNRQWLQHSLNWPQFVGSEEDTRQNMLSNRLLHQRGYAKMFLIVYSGDVVGVLSFNAIEPLNKAGYIGYWLDEDHQGQGILSACLEAFMQYYAQQGEIRRFVIKCRVENERSNRVALRNGFVLEGCLRQAEYLNGRYQDQNIYARIIEDGLK
ncbi:50S ribosomal protein L7/L12-serine acetyltransferase [Enterobacter asburiae]|uniref:50S ribosomal protein L7/L12-serine acetyltransferase n=1 Tax=unclassified Scandinavium TaxID=2830652 RepID=UPI0028A1AB26|nr:50S ribosomal protein L7/L12-serine acetyltransferase [Scandinavium sp.]